MSGASTACYYIGSISGTSVDGLDLALVDLAHGISIDATATHTFPDSLRVTLLSLGQPRSGAEDDSLDQLGQADAELGDFIGTAINEFLTARGLQPEQIIAVGSHGQTVRHRPDLDHPFTWQIGDPNRIAEITGITTVADFRRRDMAAGGQGAPLVPAFHEALFRTADESRVILNIGGISNLTLLCKDAAEPVSGFDTGPGNALLDAWCQHVRGDAYDADGAWAASGELDQDLLATFLNDAYFERPPPKSTGREVFNLQWLEQHSVERMKPADVQRTLLELTARTIIEAINRWALPCDELIVCGGGRLNGALLGRLSKLSAAQVSVTEHHGYDGDAIEAAAFAWLAARRLAGESGNSATVTGAAGLRVLGAVYPGTR